jgi:acyl carrier protein
MSDLGSAADRLSNQHAQIRRSRLLFRCWHRGTQESDLILGRFAEAHVADLNSAQLERFEVLLDCADPDLFDWIVGGSHRENTRATRLHDDLDMDDVDIVGVLCTAENRFGIILPDDFDSDASCTVDDIVDLIAKRLIQKEALLAHTANPAISARGESPNLVTETISSQLYRAADVRGDRPPGA